MALDVFTVERRWVPETQGRSLQARIDCSKCHRVQWEHVSKPGWAVRVFRAKGWLLGSKRTTDVCPGCRNQKEKRPDMSPAQRRAAYLRIEGVARAPKPEPEIEPMNTLMAERLAPIREAMTPKPHRAPWRSDNGISTRSNASRSARRALGNPNALVDVDFRVIPEPGGTYGFVIIDHPAAPKPEPQMAETEPTAPKAPAPRQPTPPENRRILDALDAHYDTGRGLYRESFTDAALATKLDVPRAWVTKVRGEFYGPEANEAALVKVAKLDVAIKLAESATERLVDMAQEAEKLANELKKAREALS